MSIFYSVKEIKKNTKNKSRFISTHHVLSPEISNKEVDLFNRQNNLQKKMENTIFYSDLKWADGINVEKKSTKFVFFFQ